MFLLGKELSSFKRLLYGLQVFEGVGLYQAQRVMDQAFIHPMCRAMDLNERQLVRLKAVLQPMVEEAKQRRLMQIRASKSRIRPILPPS